MTTATKVLTLGEIMTWVQAQRRCPICKEEQCDCWQALAEALEANAGGSGPGKEHKEGRGES